VIKLLAIALGWYPNLRAASSTLRRVFTDTGPSCEKARETDDWETPASLATSMEVICELFFMMLLSNQIFELLITSHMDYQYE
jgi:hypothetical protein